MEVLVTAFRARITDYRLLPQHAMSIPKIIAGVVFNIAFFALLLFLPAGKLHWWRAWVFLAVTAGAMAAAIFSLLADSADLFSQRAKGIIQKGQPLWDRLLIILLVISYAARSSLSPWTCFGSIFCQNPAG